MLNESDLKKLNEYLTRNTDAAQHIEAYIRKAEELEQAKAQFQRMMDYLFRMDGLVKEVKTTSPQRMVEILRGDEELRATADFAVASWTGNIWAAIDRLTKALNEAGYTRSSTLEAFTATPSAATGSAEASAPAAARNWSRPSGT